MIFTQLMGEFIQWNFIGLLLYIYTSTILLLDPEPKICFDKSIVLTFTS